MWAILDTSVVIATGIGTPDALLIAEAVDASYGQLAAAVVRAGRQPRARTIDLLIAAHAHSARVYTRNARDFAGADTLVDVIAV